MTKKDRFARLGGLGEGDIVLLIFQQLFLVKAARAKLQAAVDTDKAGLFCCFDFLPI